MIPEQYLLHSGPTSQYPVTGVQFSFGAAYKRLPGKFAPNEVARCNVDLTRTAVAKWLGVEPTHTVAFRVIRAVEVAEVRAMVEKAAGRAYEIAPGDWYEVHSD